MLAAILYAAWRKRQEALRAFASQDVIESIVSGLDNRRYFLRLGLLFVALTVMITALMRPQWGFEWEEARQRGLDIMIALDTSRSMLAEDVRPDRLARSKLAVKDLVRKLHGDRIGLIAFAGEAFVQCPLTTDYSGFMLTLDDLDVNTISEGGTSISEAISTALDSFGEGSKKYKVLVLITDGEDHEGSVPEWADRAKDAGVRVYAIGIGTRGGELIPIRDDSGSMTFLKDREGHVVKTRLDEKTLSDIALTTGGAYVRATAGAFGLDSIYRDKLSKMAKRDFKSRMVKRYYERFQVPLGIVLLLLLAEVLAGVKRHET